jgi:hypothetical protein
MVPQSPLVGFNSSAVGRRSREHASWQLRGVAPAAAGALSASGAPRPVRRRSEASGEGDRHLGVGVIDPVGVGPLADRGRLERGRRSASFVVGRSI